MKQILVSTLFLLCTGGLLACGDSIYGCDFRAASTTEPRCQERTSSLPTSEAAYKATCQAAQGTFVADGCPRTEVAGGCDITAAASGEDVVDLYYAPMSAADVEAKCMAESATFVAAP